tara:strand:- start:416 stop:529 length:114 start_codon:yes stop_codon:yes gene_type:complete
MFSVTPTYKLLYGDGFEQDKTRLTKNNFFIWILLKLK